MGERKRASSTLCFVFYEKIRKYGRRQQHKDQLQPDVQAENSSYWEWTEAL